MAGLEPLTGLSRVMTSVKVAAGGAKREGKLIFVSAYLYTYRCQLRAIDAVKSLFKTYLH